VQQQHRRRVPRPGVAEEDLHAVDEDRAVADQLRRRGGIACTHRHGGRRGNGGGGKERSAIQRHCVVPDVAARRGGGLPKTYSLPGS
jgi:hypothetical protein